MSLTTASVTKTSLAALQKLADISGVSQVRILEALITREYDDVMLGKNAVYAKPRTSQKKER